MNLMLHYIKHSTGHIIPISEHNVSIMKSIILCFDEHYPPISNCAQSTVYVHISEGEQFPDEELFP